MAAGDVLMTDLSPCLEGYWGDSCNCVVVGAEPTSRQKEMFSVAHATLMAVTEAVKPGVEARELDALCRRLLSEAGGWQLPHHTGHGLGTSFHDDPRLVPYDSTPLQAGMVLAIEPGAYDTGAGIGIRTEHIVAVTQGGCEVLTGFRHTLSQQRS
jgi:Xaa-Pro aminopeptidase